jgi:hypothetical protein
MRVSFSNALIATGINVFDSSNVQGGGERTGDFDLGSPNSLCRPSGPGIGDGGGPNSRFPNCDPQGNMLILQNPGYSVSTNADHALLHGFTRVKQGSQPCLFFSHSHSLSLIYFVDHIVSTPTIVPLVDV